MALCEFCARIPFDDLPQFPRHDSRYRIADKTALAKFGQDDGKGEPEHALGFSWQESLAAVEQSAKAGCPLCTLVQAGAERWMRHYKDAEENDDFFIEYGLDRQPIPHDQVLWVSKRYGGGDGLSVTVRNADSKQSFVVITSISISVPEDHPLSHRFKLRPIEQDSGSKESLDVAAGWQEQCHQTHEDCALVETLLPSRVLEVPESGDIIRLIEPKPGTVGRYASLSHCWGSAKFLTTTRETREARMAGISVPALPKTFRDAVAIARRLSIRYLWIDSLCICQDDRADWARESARMTAVYSGAHLVIAATHAADSSKGCFHSRVPRPTSKFTIPGVGEVYSQLVYNESEFPWSHDFEGEPLTTRGWTLQECELAPRILHYASTQMHFQCCRGRVGEDGSRPEIADTRLRNVRGRDLSTEVKVEEDRALWGRLLWNYGQRKLSHATDKLPALSGLASLFARRFGAQYVAGLWSDALIECLCWQSIGDAAPMSLSEYTGPSWSWASYAGVAATTAFGLDGELWSDVSRVEDWHVELQNQENPYGCVTSAWLRLHGPTARLTPSNWTDETDGGKRERAGLPPDARVCTKWSETDKGDHVSIDHDSLRRSEEWRQWHLKVILLAGKKYSAELSSRWGVPDDEGDAEEPPQEGDITLCYGLVVVPGTVGEGESTCWKRIGWLFLEGKEAKKILEDKEAWETVTLI
ncbi:uncharacterized protein E0L32_006135 [Thyridium curvatum]|uniref:Heterokaryon incompatibility domain-containing protein n=1 Tax=Thyridium curvatum TaxID=1093900 RepID=A0A507ARG1_9PEZI|nr:uncharacterized protein E0L32_006135 [Thyridium curvatum]TPX13405.1 hypothetical protein E0L32_006135 [Thyridium curvatum]